MVKKGMHASNKFTSMILVLPILLFIFIAIITYAYLFQNLHSLIILLVVSVAAFKLVRMK